MKAIRYCFFVSVFILLVSACTKNKNEPDPPTPGEETELSVSFPSLAFDYAGQYLGYNSLTVYSNTTWTLRAGDPAEAAWVTFDRMQGNKEGKITATVTPNPGELRTAVFYLTTENQSLPLTIRQYPEKNLQNAIPDPKFRDYCMWSFDTNHDGDLSWEEARSAKEINIYNFETSLEGIEIFSRLEILSYSYQAATELDISKNTELTRINSTQSGVKRLDLTNNKKLTTVYWQQGKLEELILLNPLLENLYCSQNLLKTLDLSGCPVLDYLQCDDNNITAFVASPGLTVIMLDNNELKEIDVSNSRNLILLSCYSNLLENLDLTHNNRLEKLYCSRNWLKTLDTENNVQLKLLSCESNQLTELNLAKNRVLEDVNCQLNKLTRLNVSQNPHISLLYCNFNELTSLHVEGVTALLVLECADNQIATLDISSNSQLRTLSCYSNRLTSLVIGKNENLQNLYCGDNLLGELDLSTNRNVTRLNTLKNKNLRTIYVWPDFYERGDFQKDSWTSYVKK